MVIPTYNEIDSLGPVVAAVRAAVSDAHVLVVDDNSPDGTGALADRLAAGDEQVHVLHRLAKDGLGRAYVAGFTWALERDFGRIVEMDADGSHQASELPLLLAALDAGADAAIGTRWMPGGSVHDWPLHRRLISRAGTGYARLMLRSRLRDLTSGYRAFTRRALESIDLDRVQGAGYVFQIEMAARLSKRGMRVTEVPITFVERRAGASKMSTAIVLEAMTWVTKAGFSPRKLS
ncbi:polyprenol monophosphomannose synthase [Glaciihabitans arcticus]|uniref:Polyprenol monophosphomannose synthase n=1 Tax=Glaciihabitans arcticus TaxID=2668039 RepID=A0A4Q9GZC9_9MICO|nr:polyprenol monophosphomannose synthase [Glaciihabitans arcticus]